MLGKPLEPGLFEACLAGFADGFSAAVVFVVGGDVADAGNEPQIRLDDGHVMPAFHPILTTDYFEYGTTANRLDHEGAAVEMGDAALGLACSDVGY